MEEPAEDKWDACGIKTKRPSSSFGVHGGFLWRKNRGRHDSLRRCPAREWACSAPVLTAWGCQEFWAGLGWGSKRKHIPESLSTQADRARINASTLCLCLHLLAFPPECARSWASHPSDCPQTTSADRWVRSWKKRHWNCFSFPFWDYSLYF